VSDAYDRRLVAAGVVAALIFCPLSYIAYVRNSLSLVKESMRGILNSYPGNTSLRDICAILVVFLSVGLKFIM
jgi:hypothetical protein